MSSCQWRNNRITKGICAPPRSSRDPISHHHEIQQLTPATCGCLRKLQGPMSLPRVGTWVSISLLWPRLQPMVLRLRPTTLWRHQEVLSLQGVNSGCFYWWKNMDGPEIESRAIYNGIVGQQVSGTANSTEPRRHFSVIDLITAESLFASWTQICETWLYARWRLLRHRREQSWLLWWMSNYPYIGVTYDKRYLGWHF